MKIERLYSIGAYTVDYDPSVPCLIIDNVGFITSQEFRTLLDKSLEIFEEKKKIHGKMGWLPNLTKADVFLEDDMKWMASYFNPRAHKAGLRHMAFVLSEDEYAAASFSVESYQEYSEEEVGDQIINRNFKDEESAKAWLREVLNVN
ncbi:hypothetical protein GCM10009122_60180 [Fulvivirga kasyanovii]|uniref:STAS/SEC14 domain-containing protein n=1 Tax=Fulvivirga kasyanovii TaxID=396812 RepID=A0ABW9RPA4_9BACT|nr:hypothetical protein [Fulvivirga kasyanovii]MTI25526.1 hypothetical protein [Fulvivirga kasyanovii]